MKSNFFTVEKMNSIKNEFDKCNGIITKLTNKYNQNIGYMARCEVDGYPNYISIYVCWNANNRVRIDTKYIAMQTALKRAQRVIKSSEKNNVKIKNDFNNIFPNDNDINRIYLTIFNNMIDGGYNNIRNYIKLFGDRVIKYYKDNSKQIIWNSNLCFLNNKEGN